MGNTLGHTANSAGFGFCRALLPWGANFAEVGSPRPIYIQTLEMGQSLPVKWTFWINSLFIAFSGNLQGKQIYRSCEPAENQLLLPYISQLQAHIDTITTHMDLPTFSATSQL